MHPIRRVFTALITSCLVSMTSYAVNVPLSLFPIDAYPQEISRWLDPQDSTYTKRLTTDAYQQQRLIEFYNHTYATQSKLADSPWNMTHITTLLTESDPDLKTLEQSLVDDFSNKDKDSRHRGYGENFHPYNATWINKIQKNMDVSQFSTLTYHKENRAITITNLNARVLPTMDPHYYHFTQAGQGYPFDNLQMSSIWVGTPVYIVGESKDKAWSLVITPHLAAWVKTQGLAKASQRFINTWRKTAKKNLAAAIKTQTPVLGADNQFKFYAYVGTVLPLKKISSEQLTVLIPVADEHQNARIQKAEVNTTAFTPMPLAATPKAFASIFSTLINRPYGWGGLNFQNDCSQELQSLFTPFGLWLPRHSSNQVNAGQLHDITPLSARERIDYLKKSGHPLMTIVYIGGHVFLYVDQYPDPHSPTDSIALTYQNLWGLSPADRSRRAIIGESVLFPLRLTYPEDPSLKSLADSSTFQVSFLDEWPAQLPTPTRPTTLKLLVYPNASNASGS